MCGPVRELRASHLASPERESMQSNWSSDLAQPVNACASLNLNPPLFVAFGNDFGAAIEQAAGAVFLGDETAIELPAPLALGPNVRKSFAAIHVAEKDVAGLELQLWQRLQDPDAVRFVGDVNSSDAGHHFRRFQGGYRFAILFPVGVQRDVFEDDPLAERAALEGTGSRG